MCMIPLERERNMVDRVTQSEGGVGFPMLLLDMSKASCLLLSFGAAMERHERCLILHKSRRTCLSLPPCCWSHHGIKDGFVLYVRHIYWLALWLVRLYLVAHVFARTRISFFFFWGSTRLFLRNVEGRKRGEQVEDHHEKSLRKWSAPSDQSNSRRRSWCCTTFSSISFLSCILFLYRYI